MTSEERRPALYESHEIAPEIQERLMRLALEYRNQNRLPPIQRGGLELALEVIRAVFLNQINLKGIPINAAEAERWVIEGLQERKSRIWQLKKIISEAEDQKEVFALPPKNLESSKAGLRDSAVKPQFSEAEKIASQLSVRKAVVPKLASELANIFLSNENANLIRRFVSSDIAQATIIRGLLGSAIIARHFEVNNPIFFDDNAIDHLIEIIDKERDLELLIERNTADVDELLSDSGVMGKIIMDIADSPDNHEEITQRIRQMLHDYTEQIISKVRSWKKVASRKNESSDPFDYWSARYQILSILPIRQINIVQEFIYESERFHAGRFLGTPTLWDSEIEIQGWLVPGENEIKEGLKLLARFGGDRYADVVSRLKAALDAWSYFSKVVDDSRVRIARNLVRLDEMEGRGGNIDDLELSSEVKRRRTELGERRRRVHRFKAQIQKGNFGVEFDSSAVQDWTSELRDSQLRDPSIREALDTIKLLDQEPRRHRLDQLGGRLRGLNKWLRFFSGYPGLNVNYVMENNVMISWLDDLIIKLSDETEPLSSNIIETAFLKEFTDEIVRQESLFDLDQLRAISKDSEVIFNNQEISLIISRYLVKICQGARSVLMQIKQQDLQLSQSIEEADALSEFWNSGVLEERIITRLLENHGDLEPFIRGSVFLTSDETSKLPADDYFRAKHLLAAYRSRNRVRWGTRLPTSEGLEAWYAEAQEQLKTARGDTAGMKKVLKLVYEFYGNALFDDPDLEGITLMNFIANLNAKIKEIESNLILPGYKRRIEELAEELEPLEVKLSQANIAQRIQTAKKKIQSAEGKIHQAEVNFLQTLKDLNLLVANQSE